MEEKMRTCGEVGGSRLCFPLCQWNPDVGGEKDVTQALRKNNPSVFKNILYSEGKYFSWGGLVCERQ